MPPDDTATEPDTTWRKSWIPTPKWAVATVSGVGTIATMLVRSDGEWTDQIAIALIGLLVGRASAYLAPNTKR